ncbi:MAG: hypothetical protein Q9162_003106 [Coniocarpon cinnabarinum]
MHTQGLLMVLISSLLWPAAARTARSQQVLKHDELSPIQKVIASLNDSSIIPEGEISETMRAPACRVEHHPLTDTVINPFTPRYFLIANWTTASAQLGNSIPPVALQEEPRYVNLARPSDDVDVGLNLATPLSLDAPGEDLPHNMVFVITDPDAPSRREPVWSEVCHLLWYGHWFSAEIHTNHIMPYKPPENGLEPIAGNFFYSQNSEQ